MRGYLAFAGFVLTIPGANWLIQNAGATCVPDGPCLIPVGFGLMAPSGVLMIGLALILRDAVHEYLGVYASVAAILIGTAVSLGIAPPALAVASGVAFLLAETADLAVYAPLRKRGLWLAVLASGIVGALLDSFIFLQIAFGSTDHAIGNAIGKFWMSAVAASCFLARARWRRSQ